MTKIIAEIGVNHNGNLDRAKELIYAARYAGADYAKFQAWRKDRWPDIEHLRLDYDSLSILFDYAERQNIPWLCTAFDRDSIAFCKEQGQTIWKVPSGLITNTDYLLEIMRTKPELVLISTGMATMNEVNYAFTFFGCEVVVMQCVTQYPAKLTELNLSLIDGVRFDGYSDHSGMVWPCIAAASRGAEWVEAHITPDKSLIGPDHKASLEPGDFREMVTAIRMIGQMLGKSVKKPTQAELEIRDKVRERMKDI
jgi:sialic acid synthase SpsE